jgi:hypothetical protein
MCEGLGDPGHALGKSSHDARIAWEPWQLFKPGSAPLPREATPMHQQPSNVPRIDKSPARPTRASLKTFEAVTQINRPF